LSKVIVGCFPFPWNGGVLLFLCCVFLRLIPQFSEKAAPLYALKKKGAQFVQEETQQRAFESLKKALCKAPVLQIPNFDKEFVLVTD
jgi:hypothetical protein